MAEWAWLATPDPSLQDLFSIEAIPPEGQNYYRYKNEQVSQWLIEADAVIDEAQRAKLLKQAQEQMADDLPIIPLYQWPVTIAYTEDLTGAETNPSLAGVYWNMGEWKLQ
jgi:peptide/nickel transport system substrate-binding protein